MAAVTDKEKVTAINRVLSLVRNIVPQTPKTDTTIQVLCNLDYRLRQRGDNLTEQGKKWAKGGQLNGTE